MKEKLKLEAEEELKKYENLKDEDLDDKQKKKLLKMVEKKKQKNINTAKTEGNYVTTTLIVLGKGKKKPKDSSLPQYAIDALPVLIRDSELPMLKVKIGAKIMTVVCENEVFEKVKPGDYVKAEMAGMVIEKAKALKKK